MLTELPRASQSNRLRSQRCSGLRKIATKPALRGRRVRRKPQVGPAHEPRRPKTYRPPKARRTVQARR